MLKIYEDPHGLDVWKPKPTRVVAIYLVDAAMYAEITGVNIPAPVTADKFAGPWFEVDDKAAKDVAGTVKFDALKTALPAFPGDTSNVSDDEFEDVPVSV